MTTLGVVAGDIVNITNDTHGAPRDGSFVVRNVYAGTAILDTTTAVAAVATANADVEITDATATVTKLASTTLSLVSAAPNLFGGHKPPNDVTSFIKGVYSYNLASRGGIFKWNSNEPVLVTEFHCDLNGAANLTLNKVTLDANDNIVFLVELKAAAAVSSVSYDASAFRVTLLGNQALQLITTTSSQVQYAQAVGITERAIMK